MNPPPIITKQGNINPKLSENKTPKAQKAGLRKEEMAIMAASVVLMMGTMVEAVGDVVVVTNSNNLEAMMEMIDKMNAKNDGTTVKTLSFELADTYLEVEKRALRKIRVK